jgi:ABC-type sugar transport system ATPase subunit
MSDDELIAAMLGRSLGRLYPERTQMPGAVVLTATGLVVPGKLGPIDLDVRKGEIFGIAALQGQGQRELLMALGGAVAWQGDVRVDGKAFTARSPAQALRSGVALVPEDRQREGLFLAHPVRYNIAISVLHRLRGWLFSVDERKELSATRDEAQRLGLPAARLGYPAAALSGGNQQKVVFCKVLLTGPRILILHDCTRGVDVGTKAEIFHVVSDLAARGTAVIFYSSDLSELVNMCDRIAVLFEGKIRGVLARGEAAEETILRLAVGSPARAAEAQLVV